MLLLLQSILEGTEVIMQRAVFQILTQNYENIVKAAKIVYKPDQFTDAGVIIFFRLDAVWIFVAIKYYWFNMADTMAAYTLDGLLLLGAK